MGEIEAILSKFQTDSERGRKEEPLSVETALMPGEQHP